MKWSPEASSLIAAAPPLMRWIVRGKIEALAKREGLHQITAEFVQAARREHQPGAKNLSAETDIAQFHAREDGDPMTDAFAAAASDVHIFAEGRTLPPKPALEAWSDAARHAPPPDRPRCLYIHVPFCRSRCVFCPFYSNRWKPEISRIYADALVAEIENLGSLPVGQAAFAAVYFGGGTPSDLAPRDLSRILHAIQSNLSLDRDAEVTLEGRVRGQSDELLESAVAGGVNRFSVGVQTFDTKLRRSLGRLADREEVTGFLATLAALPVSSVVDLMFGLPGQNLCDWQGDLRWLTDETRVSGVDLYSLKTFPGSVMEQLIRDDRMPPAADIPTSATMFSEGVRFMSRSGWDRISLSHWRRNRVERSRYNSLVKSGADCIPIGCGAGGRIGRTRFFQISDMGMYLENIRQGRKPIISAIQLGQTAGAVDHIASDVEIGRLNPVNWARPASPAGRSIRLLLEQWTRAGLLAPVEGPALELTVAGQFWSLQMGIRLARLVETFQAVSR